MCLGLELFQDQLYRQASVLFEAAICYRSRAVVLSGPTAPEGPVPACQEQTVAPDFLDSSFNEVKAAEVQCRHMLVLSYMQAGMWDR